MIDRCLPLVYQVLCRSKAGKYAGSRQTYYDCLRKQKEPQAQRIATALEIYVNGSLKVFNHRTNVELNNRIVCFDIKELGSNEKGGMSSFQDQVWNELRSTVASNLLDIISTSSIFCSKEEQTLTTYSVEIWKRFRK